MSDIFDLWLDTSQMGKHQCHCKMGKFYQLFSLGKFWNFQESYLISRYCWINSLTLAKKTDRLDKILITSATSGATVNRNIQLEQTGTSKKTVEFLKIENYCDSFENPAVVFNSVFCRNYYCIFLKILQLRSHAATQKMVWDSILFCKFELK